ncbi:MAG: hypothetical protein KatS3mg031_2820 [Chitinophagales bacterium]|nr:MAG: hypothetical protein KatS3mg031_2820 [Chitinophagales bacterium]
MNVQIIKTINEIAKECSKEYALQLTNTRMSDMDSMVIDIIKDLIDFANMHKGGGTLPGNYFSYFLEKGNYREVSVSSQYHLMLALFKILAVSDFVGASPGHFLRDAKNIIKNVRDKKQ